MDLQDKLKKEQLNIINQFEERLSRGEFLCMLSTLLDTEDIAILNEFFIFGYYKPGR